MSHLPTQLLAHSRLLPSQHALAAQRACGAGAGTGQVPRQLTEPNRSAEAVPAIFILSFQRRLGFPG